MAECPFKVGDRVRAKIPGHAYLLPATVTEVRDLEFDYRFDKPIPFVPRRGTTFTGGTSFYPHWDNYELVPKGEDTRG